MDIAHGKRGSKENFWTLALASKQQVIATQKVNLAKGRNRLTLTKLVKDLETLYILKGKIKEDCVLSSSAQELIQCLPGN